MKRLTYLFYYFFILASLKLNGQTSITTGIISGSPFCPGGSMSIPFTITGTYNSTNVFRAQLSDAAGVFGTSPIVIGSLSSKNSGTITGSLPTSILPGTAYRIRVVSTSPAITGTASSTSMEVRSSFSCSLSNSKIDELNDVAISSPTKGQLLAYNGTTWVNSTSTSNWLLTGNDGIDTAVHFLGTLNTAPLLFKVNSTKSGIVDVNSALTSLGYLSLSTNTTGSYNSAIGYASMMSNTSGILNAALGSHTLFENTTGGANTAVGSAALLHNTEGSANAALGHCALMNNISGERNIGIGISALFSNTTGSYNTAIGSYSLYSNNSGDNNTATGFWALFYNTTGRHNTANGNNSLTYNTTGSLNTATGNNALYKNTTGENNTANGNSSLFGNITGSCNTACGAGSLGNNSTGNYNSAHGFLSLNSNTTGRFNTANGWNSLYQNTTGENNSAQGNSSLFTNTTGWNNTATGSGSLFSNTTGNYNTGIGFLADVASGDLTNATVIGWGASVNASNKVRIGNNSVGVVESAAGTWTTSDGRFKNNIKDDAPGLNLILKLKPVTYNFLYTKFSEFLKEKGAQKDQLRLKEAKKEVGLVAQDVEQVCKELGIQVSNLVHVPDNAADNYSLSYGQLIVPLIKAVQEQQKMIEELKKIVEKLQSGSTASVSLFSDNKIAGVVSLSNPSAAPLLGQNIPNPVSGLALIPFRISSACQDAAIVITNLATGQILKAIPISCKETQLSVDVSNLAAGNYSYSLYIEGKVVETKKMVVSR